MEHRPFDDGTGQPTITGPLEITTQLSMALTAYAAKMKSELGGTADQRRVAGLRDMVEQYLDSPAAAKHHGRLPIVNVTISLATLLKLRAGIADIPGIGPIPADVAHWLLADGAPLRRLIIDDTNGQLLDYGTTLNTVPPQLAEYLIAEGTEPKPTATGPTRKTPTPTSSPGPAQPADSPAKSTPTTTERSYALVSSGGTPAGK